MQSAQWNYYNTQELPVGTVDWSAAGEDFSTGWTFTLRMARTTSRGVTLMVKTTGITATAGGIVTIAWSVTDWNGGTNGDGGGLEASVGGTGYYVTLWARRTADSKDIEFNPSNPITLNLYATPGTVVVPGLVTPIYVEGDLTAHLADTVDAHDASAISLLDAGGYYVSDTPEGALAEIGYSRRHMPSAQFPLRQRLAGGGLGGPAIMTLIGDSTGNDATDWFYPALTAIAAAYPAWTVQHRLWSDANQGYNAPTFIQRGTNGDAYYAPANANILSTPDSAAVSVTSSDIRIEAKVNKSALVSGVVNVIASQFGNGGNRGWYLYFTSTGFLNFDYSVDGTNIVPAVIANPSHVSALMTAGADFWIGCTFDLTNGSNSVAQAIYSTDGVTWQNFGTAVTAATIAGFFDTTAPVEVGTRTGGGFFFDGRIYSVNVWKGLTSSSPLAWRFDASLYDSGSTFVDGDGRTWTLASGATITTGAPVLLAMNGSTPGQGLSYFDNVTRRPLMLSAQSDVIIVNTGHNEGTADFGSTLSTYVTNAIALWPSSSIVVCKQNPEASNYVNYRRHARSQGKLGQQAARSNWGVIDAFQAFQDTGTPDTYVTTNDVHPTTAGYALWTTEALKSFGFA